MGRRLALGVGWGAVCLTLAARAHAEPPPADPIHAQIFAEEGGSAEAGAREAGPTVAPTRERGAPAAPRRPPPSVPPPKLPEGEMRSPAMVGLGVFFSATGFTAACTSGYPFSRLDREDLTSDERDNALRFGGGLLGGGLAFLVIGVPLAIAGSERKPATHLGAQRVALSPSAFVFD